MNSLWLQGLKGEERQKLKVFIENNQKILDILTEIVYNRVKEHESVALRDYDNLSWSHKQAHLNGELDALKWVIKLCDVTASK